MYKVPIYEAVEYPPRRSDDFTAKLTMAAEVAQTNAQRVRNAEFVMTAVEKPLHF